MVRKFFKKKSSGGKLDQFIEKYNIPRAYLSTNRKNISKGVFIGLFIGFIPMPMQMLAVVAMMPFAKFNVPIAISMVWLSNPFTMPAMYYMEYLTGSFFLGTQVAPVEITMQWFSDNLKNIFVPLYVGTLFYSVTVSSAMYFLINFLWKRSVHKERNSLKDDEE
ncbi:DUF2062 domain-containing protein [Sulfurimonas sp. HSL-1716]|uniref:DUF2062 domain-containing protein n=1 Tax=Hydrocurvibacter sulfurireducens TaxID=3131937 RepID=UPI0031F80CB1